MPYQLLHRSRYFLVLFFIFLLRVSPVDSQSAAPASSASPPASAPAATPALTEEQKKEEAERNKAYEESGAKLRTTLDKLFFGGKVEKTIKAMTDPKTYREYAEMAYSMNPIDLIYYATDDYKKELVMKSLFTITKKVAKIATPILGLQIVASVDVLDHFISLKKDQKPFEMTDGMYVEFMKDCKEVWGLEKTKGQIFDFLFVEKTGNDAVKVIQDIAKAYRDLALKMEEASLTLGAQERMKKRMLEQQLETVQKEMENQKSSLAGAGAGRQDSSGSRHQVGNDAPENHRHQQG